MAVSTSHVSRALLYDFLLGCDDIEFERESQSNRVEKRGGITSRQVSQSGRQTEEVKQRQNRKRTEEDDGNDLGVENNSR